MEEKNIENQPSPYVIPGAIILAGVLIAAAVVYSNSTGKVSVLRGNSPAGSANVGSSEAIKQVTDNLADDDPFLGSPEAPVTVVEFSDFQCPFCRRLWSETLPQLKQKYLTTGKVKFVYRDFPLSFHPAAQPAAEAGECADEQGKFWEMHDKIFEEQEKLGTGTVQFGEGELKQWARELGLKVAQFNECLDSGKYRAEVEKDSADGQAAGVTGTPGTFVNGRLISGAVPFAQFEKVIEEELKKAQ